MKKLRNHINLDQLNKTKSSLILSSINLTALYKVINSYNKETGPQSQGN